MLEKKEKKILSEKIIKVNNFKLVSTNIDTFLIIQFFFYTVQKTKLLLFWEVPNSIKKHIYVGVKHVEIWTQIFFLNLSGFQVEKNCYMQFYLCKASICPPI